MAEPPADAGLPAAPSAQDVLLATKLQVPPPQPGVVPRPRLAQQLDDGLGRGLVLVCAPAGYGKTVLLADWAQRDSDTNPMITNPIRDSGGWCCRWDAGRGPGRRSGGPAGQLRAGPQAGVVRGGAAGPGPPENDRLSCP
jgi:hypothetical protein